MVSVLSLLCSFSSARLFLLDFFVGIDLVQIADDQDFLGCVRDVLQLGAVEQFHLEQFLGDRQLLAYRIEQLAQPIGLDAEIAVGLLANAPQCDLVVCAEPDIAEFAGHGNCAYE